MFQVCDHFRGFILCELDVFQCERLAGNRVGHNEVIGVCRAGPDAVGLGRDHWNEMLAYPRKPITHWHALGEVHKSYFL